MQGKLFQRCTHLLYCRVLSLGRNVNTRRMSKPDMGSIFHVNNQWNILVIGNYHTNYQNYQNSMLLTSSDTKQTLRHLFLFTNYVEYTQLQLTFLALHSWQGVSFIKIMGTEKHLRTVNCRGNFQWPSISEVPYLINNKILRISYSVFLSFKQINKIKFPSLSLLHWSAIENYFIIRKNVFLQNFNKLYLRGTVCESCM